MKWKDFYYTLIFVAALSVATNAQPRKDYKVLLKSGAFTPERNVSADPNRPSGLRLSNAGQKSLVIIQFDDIPTEAERNQLKSEGIELLEYLPNYAYTATIAGSSNLRALARTKGRAVVELSPEQKMHPGLVVGSIPPHAYATPGKVDLWIS
jgi:hypothetical protein